MYRYECPLCLHPGKVGMSAERKRDMKAGIPLSAGYTDSGKNI